MDSLNGDDEDEKDLPKFHLPERVQVVLAWAIGISVVLLAAAGAYRLATGNLNFAQFDFSQLLSLILAIFSISLSTAFYFNATDTSNKFYNRTFNLTKNLFEKIGRMDERITEVLKGIQKEQTETRREISQSKGEKKQTNETENTTPPPASKAANSQPSSDSSSAAVSENK